MENTYFILGSIPEFDDIPKSKDTFWKKTTWNKLIDGSDGGNKVNVYKQLGTSYVLCQQIGPNDESIYLLQDNGTITDGIYRDRWDGGDTVIGSRYFRRSGREEERKHFLLRYNESGNIQYHIHILGKEEDDYRYTAYSFNPETLDWTKEIEG